MAALLYLYPPFHSGRYKDRYCSADFKATSVKKSGRDIPAAVVL